MVAILKLKSIVLHSHKKNGIRYDIHNNGALFGLWIIKVCDGWDGSNKMIKNMRRKLKVKGWWVKPNA